MTYRLLARRLGKVGCEFVRQAPGSHEIWWNPRNRRFTTIPGMNAIFPRVLSGYTA
ncbi:MAG: type II toxin-antitoxin system HicA family toxin [Chloroflexi bacterium]|nr:type II toxin-antitoxin system HicA family toxin [Chloroflexota bacterium]